MFRTQTPFRSLLSATALTALFVLCAADARAQTSAFTYQGRLTDAGSPANGAYDFEFRLYDAETGGAQLAPAQTLAGVQVMNGTFTVRLDFGAGAFASGQARYLEIGVRRGGEAGEFTLLVPRQQLTAAPYALRSQSAAASDSATRADAATSADDSSKLGGVSSSEYVRTDDPRLSGGGTPAAGSPHYIQNGTAPQAGDFNIAGSGTAGGSLSANVMNAATSYNLSGSRVLSAPGRDNLFAGLGAGAATTPASPISGYDNSFFGTDAGKANTSGGENSFFGMGAGKANTSGSGNSFFGRHTGIANTTGRGNSFFGSDTGIANTNGSINSFFGEAAGLNNTTGGGNSFFGFRNGFYNTAGIDNSFFGNAAGEYNTTGRDNSFFGRSAGNTNKTGSQNTYLGAYSDGLDGLANATAVGYLAYVTQSNSLVLGSIKGLNFATADTNVGIGTSAPPVRLTVQTPTSNYGIVHTDGSITVGTFVGGAGNGGYIGTKSSHPLHLFANDGPASLTIDTAGRVRVVNLGSAGVTQLCRNASNQISACSSSLRYKTNVAPFSSGLGLVRRLRPITFDWREGGARDLGLGAEDVARVEPLLATYNEKGEVEGVKYDRVAVVLVNAVREQQAQLERQRDEIARQREEIRRLAAAVEGLKRLAGANRRGGHGAARRR